MNSYIDNGKNYGGSFVWAEILGASKLKFIQILFTFVPFDWNAVSIKQRVNDLGVVA